MKRYLFTLSLSISAAAAGAQILSPDSSFGTYGIVRSPRTAHNSIVADLAFQADGKVIACGSLHDDRYEKRYSYLRRYHNDGRTDSSFGTYGYVFSAADTNDEGHAVLLQPDGRIVVAGTETQIVTSPTYSLITRPFVSRYLASGKPDSSFGLYGTVRTGIPYAYLTSIALRSDGRLIAGGGIKKAGREQFMALCLNPDGSFHTSFGSGGMTSLELEAGKNAVAFHMALQADDKLILAGYSGEALVTGPPNTRMAMARLRADGQPDSSFGTYGRVLTAISTLMFPFDIASQVVLLPDGRILLGGGSDSRLALVCYKPDGSTDLSFGSSGILVYPDIPEAQCMVLDETGRILVSGLLKAGAANTDISLTRLSADGSIDSSSGSRPYIRVDWSDRDRAYTLKAAKKQVWLAGHSEAADASVCFSIGRYAASRGTSVPKTSIAANALIYPNPSSGQLTIDFRERPAGTGIQARILSTGGQLLLSTMLTEARNDISLAALASGHYILQLSAAGWSEYRSLICR